MDLGLRDKVAFVAAASKGLGFAVADELAAEGAKLLICARNADSLNEASRLLKRNRKVEVLSIRGDISVVEDIERIVSRGMDVFGQIDILVTNSGGPRSGTFDELSAEDWDSATANLLTSVVAMIRLVLPGMQERGWGRILNITSIAAKQPIGNLMLSNSLRAAVTGLAKTLATEVAASGVTVNNLLPGYTATERVEELAKTLGFNENIDPGLIRSRWESEIPMKRLGRPQEFAALAAFLVSERASYVTGTSISVDGGWTRSLF